jgi:hypothetical protein
MKKRSFYLSLLALVALSAGFIIYTQPREILFMLGLVVFFWGGVIFQHPVFLSTLIGVSLGLTILKRKITLFALILFALGSGIMIFGNPQARPPINSVNAAIKPVVPFSYLKGNYKGNIKGTWKYHGDDTPYRGVDYSVYVSHDEQFEVYCGVSELSDYKDPDQQYYTLDKVKLFGGELRMRCSYSGLGSLPSYICNIYHPITTDAHIRIAFNTAYDVPKDQWDSFFADFAKHIESEIPKNEMPNLEQICRQLKNQHNQKNKENK